MTCVPELILVENVLILLLPIPVTVVIRMISYSNSSLICILVLVSYGNWIDGFPGRSLATDLIGFFVLPLTRIRLESMIWNSIVACLVFMKIKIDWWFSSNHWLVWRWPMKEKLLFRFIFLRLFIDFTIDQVYSNVRWCEIQV